MFSVKVPEGKSILSKPCYRNAYILFSPSEVISRASYERRLGLIQAAVIRKQLSFKVADYELATFDFDRWKDQKRSLAVACEDLTRLQGGEYDMAFFAGSEMSIFVALVAASAYIGNLQLINLADPGSILDQTLSTWFDAPISLMFESRPYGYAFC